MHDTPQVADNERQVSIRLPATAVARAEAVAAVLTERLPGKGAEVKRADALRMAILTGLDALERELGITVADGESGQ